MRLIEQIVHCILAPLEHIAEHYWAPLVDAAADAINFHIQCWIQLIEWITKWIRGEE